MTVVDRNPVPFTVKVTGPDPAGTDVGLIDAMVGGGGVPPPELLGDAEPQPTTNAERPVLKRSRQRWRDFISGAGL